MPQWGMNMTEGTIVEWFKQPGDHVEKGEPLVEIEIAKSVNTMDSPISGTIREHLAKVDDTIPVNGVIATIEPEPGQ